MRKLELARGGALGKANVIEGDNVLNEDGLRYEDEFVRHKILDALGDLLLCGAQIIGQYEGIKAGHHMNNEILRKLFATKDAWEFVELTETQYRALTATEKARTEMKKSGTFVVLGKQAGEHAAV